VRVPERAPQTDHHSPALGPEQALKPERLARGPEPVRRTGHLQRVREPALGRAWPAREQVPERAPRTDHHSPALGPEQALEPARLAREPVQRTGHPPPAREPGQASQVWQALVRAPALVQQTGRLPPALVPEREQVPARERVLARVPRRDRLPQAPVPARAWQALAREPVPAQQRDHPPPARVPEQVPARQARVPRTDRPLLGLAREQAWRGLAREPERVQQTDRRRPARGQERVPARVRLVPEPALALPARERTDRPPQGPALGQGPELAREQEQVPERTDHRRRARGPDAESPELARREPARVQALARPAREPVLARGPEREQTDRPQPARALAAEPQVQVRALVPPEPEPVPQEREQALARGQEPEQTDRLRREPARDAASPERVPVPVQQVLVPQARVPVQVPVRARFRRQRRMDPWRRLPSRRAEPRAAACRGGLRSRWSCLLPGEPVRG
jgi:hypothetical protein